VQSPPPRIRQRSPTGGRLLGHRKGTAAIKSGEPACLPNFWRLESARPVPARRAARGGTPERVPRTISFIKRIDGTHAAIATDR
jgi:hypothetical protein